MVLETERWQNAQGLISGVGVEVMVDCAVKVMLETEPARGG